MSFDHNRLAFWLGHVLQGQPDPRQFVVGVNGGRARRSVRNHYIPDVFVAPMIHAASLWNRDDALEVYREPLLLVFEV